MILAYDLLAIIYFISKVFFSFFFPSPNKLQYIINVTVNNRVIRFIAMVWNRN